VPTLTIQQRDYLSGMDTDRYGFCSTDWKGTPRRSSTRGLADWQCVVNKVRARHRRKTCFMSGFDEVVAGLYPSKRRWFLERAKMCWGMPQAEGKQ
jgi:hypothetical protein